MNKPSKGFKRLANNLKCAAQSSYFLPVFVGVLVLGFSSAGFCADPTSSGSSSAITAIFDPICKLLDTVLFGIGLKKIVLTVSGSFVLYKVIFDSHWKLFIYWLIGAAVIGNFTKIRDMVITVTG